MKIYNYHRETFEFTGSGFADPSPLEPGVFLFPAFSTPVEPPRAQEKRAHVWSGTAWTTVADHRGELWWKAGQSVQISRLGDPALEGWSPDGPPETAQGETPVWRDDEWVVVPDHRGEIWYQLNGLPVHITEPGDPADLGLVPVMPEPLPEIISDRQFFHLLAIREIVTQAEALAAVKTGDMPAAIQALINALPESQRFGATMLLSGATEFRRTHPLSDAFAQMLGWTAEQKDRFWTEASQI